MVEAKGETKFIFLHFYHQPYTRLRFEVVEGAERECALIWYDLCLNSMSNRFWSE